MERKRAVVGLVKNSEGKILLGRKGEEADHPLRGVWHVPGETIEDGESDIDALVRGMREEAGIEIEIVSFLGTAESSNGYRVNWYLCRSENVDLVVGSDLEEARWVTIEEMLELNGEVAQSFWPDEVRGLFKT